MGKVFRSKSKKVDVPRKGYANGTIEAISFSHKGIQINDIWYNWGERVTCRKIQRVDGIWTSYGDRKYFGVLKKGMQVKLSYLNYNNGEHRWNWISSIGIIDAPAERTVLELYEEVAA